MFRKITLFGVVLTLIIIVLGSYIRLSGADLALSNQSFIEVLKGSESCLSGGYIRFGGLVAGLVFMAATTMPFSRNDDFINSVGFSWFTSGLGVLG